MISGTEKCPTCGQPLTFVTKTFKTYKGQIIPIVFLPIYSSGYADGLANAPSEVALEPYKQSVYNAGYDDGVGDATNIGAIG